MKTFDKIISRNDYTTMSVILREKAQEIAQKIAQKMYSLELDCQEGEELHPDFAVTIADRYYVCVNGATARHLVVVCGGRVQGLTKNYAGILAKNEKLIDFLNDAREIIHQLDEKEAFKVTKIKKTLERVVELNKTDEGKSDKYNLVRLFSDFLRKENVYDKFLKNLSNITVPMLVVKHINHPEDFIWYAFVWQQTNEGHEFWYDISHKWINYHYYSMLNK